VKIIGIITFLLLNSCLLNNSSNREGRDFTGVQASNLEIEGILNPTTGIYEQKVSVLKDHSSLLKFKIKDLEKYAQKSLLVDVSFGHLKEDVKTLQGSIDTEGEDYFLLVSLFGKPFDDLDLKYNLFDYSSYGNLIFSSPSIVQDNLDSNLYCRGLSLSDDPTSNGSSCNKQGDICLYSYAKIRDQGLFNVSSSEHVTPSLLQYNKSNGVVLNESEKCLDDANTILVNNSNRSFNSTFAIDSNSFIYRGPYASDDSGNWEISNAAIIGEYGIFLEELTGSGVENKGYHSKLFPIASKIKLSEVDLYIGSSTPYGQRVNKSALDSAGVTVDWMGGCNQRLSTKSLITGEDISSCNISASIDIYYLEAGEKYYIASTSSGTVSKDIKLQVVSKVSSDVSGTVACYSNSGCSAGECCRGNQCISDAQCATSGGKKAVGETCDTDFACASGCCKGDVCSPHNDTQSCDKPQGGSCLNATFCAYDPDLWTTRVFKDADTQCPKEKCNVSRFICKDQKCESKPLGADGAGTFNNPFDSYPNYSSTQDCGGSIPRDDEEIGWNCQPFP